MKTFDTAAETKMAEVSEAYHASTARYVWDTLILDETEKTFSQLVEAGTVNQWNGVHKRAKALNLL